MKRHIIFLIILLSFTISISAQVTNNKQLMRSQTYYIEDIVIRGNFRTEPEIIHQQITFQIGEILSKVKLLQTRENLIKCNYFDSVTISVIPGSLKNLRKILIKVKEDMLDIGTVGVGYSLMISLFGYYSVGHDHGWGINESIGTYNFAGKGIYLMQTIYYQKTRQFYNVEMAYPRICHTPYTFSASLSYDNQEKLETHLINTENILYYYEQTISSTFGMSRYIVKDVNLACDYGIKFRQYYRFEPFSQNGSDVPNDPLLRENKEKDNIACSSITLTLDYDTRNNYYIPKKGHRIIQNCSIIGGPLQGHDKYLQLTTDASKYFELFNNFVIALHGNFSVITKGITDDPVEINYLDLLRIGGLSTIRGYQYYENQWWNGGRSRIYFNYENRFSITDEMWGLLFLDCGNVWEETKDISFNIKEYYFSAGTGLRFFSRYYLIKFYISKRFYYNENIHTWHTDNKGLGNWELNLAIGHLFELFKVDHGQERIHNRSDWW